jgi:uncharacterized membrane protein (DUF373 family)
LRVCGYQTDTTGAHAGPHLRALLRAPEQSETSREWAAGVRLIFEAAATAQLLSEVVFVLILMEVYRLLIFYLREHRISVALTVEVALVSTIREVMLKGAHEFEWLRLVAISLLLLVLGGLLAMVRWMGRCRNEVSETDVR